MSPEPVRLPITYQEASAMMVAFSAPTAALRALTPAGLRVVESWPGRAPLVIACFEYRRSSVGAYGEVGLSWPVLPSARRAPPLLPLLLEQHWPELGYWVHELPVTTEIANQAGRTLWGYPKRVSQISFDWDGATRSCTLADAGAQVFKLSLDTRMHAVPQRFAMRTYSILDGDLLATRIQVDAVGLRRRGGKARLELGPHPMGRELAGLDLAAARPLEVRWFPVFRAVLPAAESRRHLAAGPAARSRPSAA